MRLPPYHACGFGVPAAARMSRRGAPRPSPYLVVEEAPHACTHTPVQQLAWSTHGRGPGARHAAGRPAVIALFELVPWAGGGCAVRTAWYPDKPRGDPTCV